MAQDVIGLVVLVIVVWLALTVMKLNDRVRRLSYRLDLITQGNDFPDHPANEELKELIRNKKDIEAVKRVRETMGLSLVEAKHYVDELKRRQAGVAN